VYDCIVVQDLGEKQDNSEGELDGESDASDSDTDDVMMEIEAGGEQINIDKKCE